MISKIKQITTLVAILILAFQLNAQDKRIAVISFFADKTIDLSEIDASADLIIKNTNLSESDDFNLKAPLEKFHKAFFSEYLDNFSFTTITEEEMFNSEAYKAFTPDYKKLLTPHNDSLYETIEGYKTIRQIKPVFKDLIPKLVEELDVDGVMLVYLSFGFNKTGIGKFGYMSIQAKVGIDLYDKNGKSVFLFHELAGSKKKAVMVGGLPVMKPEKITPMCDSALDALMKDMNKKLQRLSKKASKKLNKL